jgi:hypothetical protein
MKFYIFLFFAVLSHFVGAQTKSQVTLMGVGDIMMGTNYPSVAYLPPNDGATLLDSVKTILQSADITFGNLEGTLLDQGGELKNCSNPNACYAFRQPTRYAKYLTDAGFDVMSVANNHLGDFGNTGRQSTMNTLKAENMPYAGQLSCPTVVFEREGIKYGMAAFAPNTGTVDIRDIANAKRIVAGLDSVCDIVIVSFHGGAEGSKHTRVTRQTEIFYGENRGNVYAFAHAVIDAGADVVFGHGPHVTRAIEVYKDRFISYSLGNFCTYGRFNLAGINGLAPMAAITTDTTGRFIQAKIYSIKQIGEGIPRLDPMQGAYNEIKRLTALDFPENKLRFSADGIITLTK